MREKKLHLKRIFLGILAVICIGMGWLVTRDTEPPQITVIDQTVDYGTKLSVSDLAVIEDNRSREFETSILSENLKGLTVDQDNQYIVFDDVGNYDIDFSVMDKAGNESQGRVHVDVVDSRAPELISISSDVHIGYHEELKLHLNGTISESVIDVRAEDKSDMSACISNIKTADNQEISSDIYRLEDNKTVIKFAEPGKYILTFSVQDEFNNSVSGDVVVDVADRISPEFNGLKTKYVLSESDDAPEYLDGVTAEDEIDGDLTKKISLDAADVSYGVVGEYTVVYSVSDHAGNICEKEVPVIIKDSTPPVLSLEKSSFTLTEGDGRPDYLSFISAIDAIDGDVSGGIEVDDSNVDYDSAGTYTVSCKVTDSSGNASSRKITVKIKAVQNDDSDNSGSSGGETVLITRTGECYHTHKCGNGTYFPVSLSEALSRGLRPCKKCY
ncbi:MAG: DUF5011 domain-containing protein [Lachnospiraceae bacterium]|nr:DUF5011 domain-containing protein [Lachnospiraceae bacterium]